MIYIDDRSGSQLLINSEYLTDAELSKFEDLGLSGDVYFCGLDINTQEPILIGIELKSLPDFISSVNSGRLQSGIDYSQLISMVGQFDKVYLIVYGRWRCDDDDNVQYKYKSRWRPLQIGKPNSKRNVSYNYLQSCLLGCQSINVTCIETDSIDNAAKCIKNMHRWWNKRSHRFTRVFNTSGHIQIRHEWSVPDDVKTRARVASQMLRGMGVEKSLSAGNYFQSLIEMILASEEEWCKVPGIGKTVAKLLYSEARRGLDKNQLRSVRIHNLESRLGDHRNAS